MRLQQMCSSICQPDFDLAGGDPIELCMELAAWFEQILFPSGKFPITAGSVLKRQSDRAIRSMCLGNAVCSEGRAAGPSPQIWLLSEPSFYSMTQSADFTAENFGGCFLARLDT
jgi:hypothetical protein